ncbi:MAG: alanine--tRNA ligase, partial [Clostridia bacterium]|nr:alanine--tRNA ligase [Clostridia bacterium]
LRRAARHGRLLGIGGSFLYKIAKTVMEESKGAYPELEEKFEYIEKVIKNEEERFAETIDQGLVILEDYIKEIKDAGEKTLGGDKAFKLYDTYGFPIDLTKEIAEEKDIIVDEDGFTALMNEQKERARSARGDMEDAAWEEDIFKFIKDATIFEGYTADEAEGKILAIAKDNALCDEATEGDEVTVVLDKTAFYAESGGQVGDSGVIEGNGFMLEVLDVKKQNGKFLHKAVVKSGTVKVNDSATTKIAKCRRNAIRRNPTAAHLLQAALKNALGNHVAQAGSYVSEDRMRFDFSHFSAMTDEEIKKVETEVNMAILSCIPVENFEAPIEEAKKLGATALFGEKYGDTVRIVKIDDYSVEFCGGTHAKNTGNLGLFKIVSESGVAAGVRRIEAVTGFGVLELLSKTENTVAETAKALKSNITEVASKAVSLTEELKEAKREIESLKSKMAQGSIGDLINEAEEVNGIKIITKKMDDGLDMNSLRNAGDSLKQKAPCSVIVLA